MRKIHLLWIIPIVFVISFIVSMLITTMSIAYMKINYPVVGCIWDLENTLNVESNVMTFTKESQRKAIEYVCVREHLELDVPDYKEVLEFDLNK